MGRIYELMGATGSLIMCASSIPQLIRTCRAKCTMVSKEKYIEEEKPEKERKNRV
jgi:uncharacterized protein with PQ loop repeat